MKTNAQQYSHSNSGYNNNASPRLSANEFTANLSPASSFSYSPDYLSSMHHQQLQVLQQYHNTHNSNNKFQRQPYYHHKRNRSASKLLRRRLLPWMYLIILLLTFGYMFYSISFVIQHAYNMSSAIQNDKVCS